MMTRYSGVFCPPASPWTRPLRPPDDDWLLKYRFDTPPLPTAGWILTEHTFFIWGDVDFD